MYEIYTKEYLFIQKNSIFLQELHSYWHSFLVGTKVPSCVIFVFNVEDMEII